MSEVVVVGSFKAQPGREADIVVYAPLEGGEPKKGSLARHAGG